MDLIKFFTTGALGAILCLLTYYGGSIFPSMFAHFTINFISIILTKYATEQMAQSLNNPVFGIVGVAAVAVGLFIVKNSNKKIVEVVSAAET